VLTTLAGASFPRAARVLESDDFARALKTRAQRGRFLWVYRRSVEQSNAEAPSPQTTRAARPQLGLMIGKRNARTAVLRNAVKRRIREQFRLRQNALQPSQYVVRLSLSITTKDVAAVIAEWTATLDRYVAKSAAAAATGAVQSQTPRAAPSVTA
jgi:ribonuclease P protein component